MSSLLALLLAVVVGSAPQAPSARETGARQPPAGSSAAAAPPIVQAPDQSPVAPATSREQSPAAAGTSVQQSPATAGTSGQQAQAGAGTSGQEVAGADVDRIKKGLQHPDLLKLDIPSNLPAGSTRYRVEVKAYSFKLPTLAESLHIPWAPTPPGGLYNYEIMQMITPPEVRGSAPFTNGEMAWVAATSLLSALAMREVTSAYRGFQRSWRTWQEEQAHEEVERELAEFLRQQTAAKAKNAAATPDPAKKDPNKKKPDEK
jgi:hypothetical protein